MGCDNKLVTPAMASGQTLTGYTIHKIFGTKAMYLRLQVELIAAKVKLMLDLPTVIKHVLTFQC